LREAFRGVDFVLVASNTTQYAKQVAQAALEANIDYLDIQYSQTQFALLQTLAPEIERAGRCFVTQGGFHPGLPAALIRYAGTQFDQMQSAISGSVINQEGGLSQTESIYELVEAFKEFKTTIFKNGQWKEGGWYETRPIDFGEPFGKRACFPMYFDELKPLPELYPSLQETGFYIAGLNWFVDWIVTPFVFVGLNLFGDRAVKPLGELMRWGINKFTSPPFGVVLKVDARGLKNGQPKTVSITAYHRDGWQFTAIPVVALLLQYLDGLIRKPGLHLMGQLADPARLVADMQRMGVRVQETRFLQENGFLKG
jgi:saccharopine dehydrogenase (NAD+, L-lysine-forming)